MPTDEHNLRQPLTVTFLYQKQDFLDFAKEQSKRIILILAIVSLVFAFFQILPFLMADGEVNSKETTAAISRIGLYLLMLGMMGGVLVYLTRKRAVQAFQNFPMFHSEVVYTFSGVGLAGRSADFEFNLEWPTVFRVKEFHSCFAVYQNRALAIIVPKRVLSEHQVGELRSILAASGARKVKLMG